MSLRDDSQAQPAHDLIGVAISSSLCHYQARRGNPVFRKKHVSQNRLRVALFLVTILKGKYLPSVPTFYAISILFFSMRFDAACVFFFFGVNTGKLIHVTFC